MESKHTPGPWKYVPGKFPGALGGIKALFENMITTSDGSQLICEIMVTGAERWREEEQANAELIAAAPETAAERDALKAELREARIFISNLGMERDELLEAAGMLVRYASQAAYDENVLNQLVEQLGEIIDKANGKTKG